MLQPRASNPGAPTRRKPFCGGPRHEPTHPSVAGFSAVRAATRVRQRPAAVDGVPALISRAYGIRRRRAGSRHHGRGDPCRDVAITIATAPAQDITGMFTAPSVNDLGGHLKLVTMLASIFDQRAEVIDKFSGRIVSDVRGAGERFMVYRPT